MPGPLQVMAVSFRPGSDFQGRVLAEVDRLQGRGLLRVLDMLVVAKNEDGTIEPVVVVGDEDLGALLSSIVPLAGEGLMEPAADDGSAAFDPADAWALAESLLPGTALAFLLIEHAWAQSLFEAIAETGGTMLGEGFLTPEAGLLVGAEVAAMEEAAEVIAAAQAAQVRATLLAMEAEEQAEEAIAASQEIRTAAAASALQALIAAGIVEDTAAHEAVEALSAAGIVIAEADERAAEAIAEDEAAVRRADEAAARIIADDETDVIAADRAAAAAIADDEAAVRRADEATEEAVAEDAAVVTAADQATTEAVAEAAATVRAASITEAEARVLRYLPTRLTFALIANKLGISRSAAKERAERAYKKLGVHNRADAVNRARALGLID